VGRVGLGRWVYAQLLHTLGGQPQRLVFDVPTRVFGVDVGGLAKGFHVADLPVGMHEISRLIHCPTAKDVRKLIGAAADSAENARILVAIDCPPRCRIRGVHTRLAERQLHRMGVHVQWTRRCSHEPTAWMFNGEDLWMLLENLPGVEVIETLPSVAAARLRGSTLRLPLSLLAGQAERRDWKDLVDAAICAEVGERYLRGGAEHVGLDPVTGEKDELGLIWY
jgi:predicted nuclease with RNAse H fold